MYCRFYSLFTLTHITLALFGCGGSTPKENAPTPLIEIAQEDHTLPVETSADDAEDDKRHATTGAVELADKCLVKLRDGRGLPPDVLASDAGQQYTEALVHERAERLNEARKGFLTVIQRYPQSRFVPLTYFAFGELFLREVKSDPTKVVFAEQSYREVMKYPLPDNTAMAFSLYRLGEIFSQSGKGPESLNMLSKFMTLAEAHPEALCATALGESARKLMASAYAEAGQPNRAFSFFVHSTGDRASGKINAFDTLANLCDIYIGQQKPASAAEALVAVNEDHAEWAFCTREQRILTQISTSIAVPMREELMRKHATRCEKR